MDFVGWLWWGLTTAVGAVWALVWFLISGWISALLQIALLIIAIYFVKYGWQRAPAEIWRRTRAFAGFFWSWLRAREPQMASGGEVREVIKVVHTKEFADINLSTLLSLLMLVGLFLLASAAP